MVMPKYRDYSIFIQAELVNPKHIRGIDLPLGSQMFTVGGPLASDAKLTQNGQPAKLRDYSVNEQVTVIFHSTDQGHLIDRLMG